MRQAVQDLGQTIVRLTHAPVAASYADRVVFLKDGQIVRELRNDGAEHNVQAIIDVMAGLEL